MLEGEKSEWRQGQLLRADEQFDDQIIYPRKVISEASQGTWKDSLVSENAVSLQSGCLYIAAMANF